MMNNIGDQGCFYLSKVNWPNLKCIHICNVSPIIEILTILVLKDARISEKHTGLT